MTARLAAARLLVELDRRRTTLADAIESQRTRLTDVRERALLLELAGGTLRWRNAIDWSLERASSRPLAKMSPAVRAVLRIAAYQIRFLDRIPVRAAVHEAVAGIRNLGEARAAGFVNAVLRSLLRRSEAWPPRPADRHDRAADLAYLSITLSHPEWLASRWLDRYGFEAAEAWCRFNNAVPDATVRPLGRSVRDLHERLQQAGVSAKAAPFAPGALRLPAGTLGHLPPALRDSLIVQDEGSQLVALATNVAPGEHVLDVCAAPGGKTLMLADALAGSGLLISADVRPGRIATLSATVRRAGLSIPILALDATTALPFGPVFDCVLLDAPCSGLGTVRRDPDVKWSRTPEDLERQATRQLTMARCAAAVVRPGGRLVYATCSSEPEENEAIVAGFLAAHPDFAAVPVTLPPAVPRAASLVSPDGWLATRPFRDGLDAFFAAVLVRRRAA